jgi:hypothetical protein
LNSETFTVAGINGKEGGWQISLNCMESFLRYEIKESLQQKEQEQQQEQEGYSHRAAIAANKVALICFENVLLL